MSTQTLTRRKVASRPNQYYSPGGTPAVATPTLVSTKMQIDFSAAVQVVQLPTDFLVNGQPATGYVQNSPTRITLTYAVAVATGQTWVIPARSLNVRTTTGGFVAAATGTF
jgi:hypothetical protein